MAGGSSYRLLFLPLWTTGLGDRWYGDSISWGNARDLAASGTPLDASIALAPGYRLGVQVNSGGAPLDSARVSVYAVEGDSFSESQLVSIQGLEAGKAHGTFSLPNGLYRVRFSASGYVTQWWNNQPGASTATILSVNGAAIEVQGDLPRTP